MIPAVRQTMPSARGFTLIEMLVVMVLLGLMTGLALPAMQRWHDGVQARTQSTAIIESLRAAAFAAGASRRDMLMDADSFAPTITAPTSTAATGATVSGAGIGPRRVSVAIPPGWQVQRVVDATFLANGLCRPGLVALRTDGGASMVIQVNGPVCGVELSTAALVQGS